MQRKTLVLPGLAFQLQGVFPGITGLRGKNSRPSKCEAANEAAHDLFQLWASSKYQVLGQITLYPFAVVRYGSTNDPQHLVKS